MPFNLLLLPLLGGYWLLRKLHRTRFRLARQDVQRVLIWSATVGFGLLLVSALLVSALLVSALLGVAQVLPGDDVARVQAGWHLFSPFPHSGKAVLALLLGGVAPQILNRIPLCDLNRPDVWSRLATDFHGDENEALIFRAQKLNLPVLVTLRSGKVYVGFVQRNLNPEVERRHLRLLPVVSGYRKPPELKVDFTTLYEQVREEARQHTSQFHGLLDRDFEIVVPLTEVVTMSLFDFDAFEAFNRPAPAAPPSPKPARRKRRPRR